MAECAADRELKWLVRIIRREELHRQKGGRFNRRRVLNAAGIAVDWKRGGPYCRCTGRVKGQCKQREGT